MKTDQPLRDTARRLLDLFGVDGKHWTKGTLARTKKGGREVDPEDEKAGAWCLMGGLERLGELNQGNVLKKHISNETGSWGVENFNDSHQWPTVRELLMKLAHPYQPKQKAK